MQVFLALSLSLTLIISVTPSELEAARRERRSVTSPVCLSVRQYMRTCSPAGQPVCPAAALSQAVLRIAYALAALLYTGLVFGFP